MKRIKKINALGRVFRVVRRRIKNADGMCCPTTEKITISPDAENIVGVVLHEVMHAMIFSGGLYDALDGNESLIEMISEQTSRVMRENFIIIPKPEILEK